MTQSLSLKPLPAQIMVWAVVGSFNPNSDLNQDEMPEISDFTLWNDQVALKT